MDIGIGVVIGTLWRWIFNAIKKALGLQDTSAQWIMLILSLLMAVAYNMISGGFAGIEFELGNPIGMLEAVTAAWATIVATAQAWYGLTKDRS